MIVQHRLIGNIPGRGHGDPLLSTAFPLDSVLATAAVYRAPDPGLIPAQASRISEDGKYHVFLSTFEIQATHFGRYALINANVFRPVNTTVRPMIYMNTVAMTGESGAPLAFLPIDSLLTFDGFIQPAQFSALNAASKALASTAWQPTAAPQRKPFFAPKTAAHRALLSRYWSAASSRMFGGNVQPLSICLGEQIQCTAIIEDAKSLLLCDILSYLPPSVSNIASMSAGTLEASIRGVFKDSALVVVYPTAPGEKQPAFDLRSKNSYPTLSAPEDQFITSMLENGFSSFMRSAISRYMKLTGCMDEAQVSFAADYDFALLLYQIECSVTGTQPMLPASAYMAAWKQLNTYLISRHHLSSSQVNEVLADVEMKLMPIFLESKETVDSIDAAMLPALWEKALTVHEALFPYFSRLIAVSPAAPLFPQMVEGFPNLTDDQTRRTAMLIAQISTDYCAHHPLTAQMVSQMTATSFSSIVTAHPQICDALRELLRRSNETFPQNLLTTIPLSCALLNGRQALADAITLLNRSYVASLPSAEQIANLSSACSLYADHELRAALCDYFAACLPEQLNQLERLDDMILLLTPKTDDALVSLISSAEKNGILLHAAQVCTLFKLLIPQCDNPAHIGQLYAAYESRLSAQTGETSIARLDRLAASADTLRTVHYDATYAAEQMLHVFAKECRLLTPEQSAAFVGVLWPLCTDPSRISAAFHDYLLSITQGDPQYYFTHTEALRSLTPFIDVSQTDMTQTVCGILESIATSSPCAPAEQLSAFFGQLLPQCREKARVCNLFFDYIDISIQDSLSQRTDCFPWLEEIQTLCAHYAALSEHRPRVLEKTVRYLCDSCSAETRLFSAPAQAWLIRLAHSKPDLFAAYSDRILALYETLLGTSCSKQAAVQLLGLLPCFGSTVRYPAICALDQQMTCSNFCKLLAKSTFDGALSEIRPDMMRCGLDEATLLVRTRNDAISALRAEFSAIKKPEDFEQAHINVALSSKDKLHNEVLAVVFTERTAKQMGSSSSLAEMEKLNTIASRLGAKINHLPETIRRLTQIITQPDAGSRQFCECLSIINEDSDSAAHITRELTNLIKKEMPKLTYPQVIYAAMLCHLSPKGDRINWAAVFSMLGMDASQKMPQPYSPQGQAWLATIHAVCRALDSLASQPGCNFGPQFQQYLQQGVFVDFFNGLVANEKRLNHFFPFESIQSPLMRKWLEH